MVTKRLRPRRRRLALIVTGALIAAVVAGGPVSIERADAAPRGARITSDAPSPEPTPSGTPLAPSGTPSAPSGTPTAPSGTPSDLSGTPSGTPSAPDTGATPAPGAAGFPAFGAYLDYGPSGVTRMTQLSQWLGGADLRVGHTYLPGDRWSNIEGSPEFLDSWAKWRRERDDRLFVLNVPMLERNEAGVSDGDVRALLQRGAAGQFDQHFRTLAEHLVALKVPDTVIVLGWEMNGVTYTHRCGPDPGAWRKYWTRIVTAMRAVPGQQFRFDFTPSRGRDAVPWTRCYPGDSVVDIIGMDAYDQPQGLSFDQQISEPYGLERQVDFAKKHGKPVSYPEWGLFRNGDNPEYMRRMLAWMDEHKALYNTLTDYCPHGVWQCARNPQASKVYRAALTGRDKLTAPTGPAAPTGPVMPSAPAAPSAPPAPTAPAAPATLRSCAPVRLGDWVEKWIGGRVCLRLGRWGQRS